MDKLKTIKVLQSLEERVFEICDEGDRYLEGILKWAGELEDIVEKEFSTKNEFPFQLPKTPCERKLRTKRTKNTLVRKASVMNSTLFANDMTNMDTTISSRTRSARRVLTSKMSQLNIPTDDKLEVKLELSELDKTNKTDLASETFVLPPSNSTRTKPVRKKEQNTEEHAETKMEETKSSSPEVSVQEKIQPEIETKRSSRLGIWNESQVETNKETSTAPCESPGRRRSRSIFSSTQSHSPVGENNKVSAVRSPNRCSQNASGPSHKTSVEEPIRRKISRALSESPIPRPSKYSKTFTKSIGDRLSKDKTLKTGSLTPESNLPERGSRRITRTLSESPKQSPGKNSKTFTKTMLNEPSKMSSPAPDLPCRTFRISRPPSQSPISRSTRIMNSIPSLSAVDGAERSLSLRGKTNLASTPMPPSNSKTCEETLLNETVTIASEPIEKTAATFLIGQMEIDEEKTPVVSRGRLSRLSKTSTSRPVSNRENSSPSKNKVDGFEEALAAVKTENVDAVPESEDEEEEDEDAEKECLVPKKKKKMKKKKLSAEKSVEEPMENFRITRTKSKAMKEKLKQDAMSEAQQQQNFTEFAKKILNKAKQSAQKKNQLNALRESMTTPKHGPPFGGFPTSLLLSKTKYQAMLSSSKKPKTPLATLSNSAAKKPQSVNKKRDSQTRAGTKDVINEMKLQSKKNKEDEAAKKRQKVIQNKKEELKRKNELKHQLAMKQREKLEQEKYNNMIQSEREKEERHKIILQERQMKLKEEAFKKKMMTQQKIAETVERRRLEEEARIAKLKEMEAEEQRIALEKQKEQERLEKREQERLALKKAREEYEMQMKRELELERLRAEKACSASKKGTDFLASASKMQSATKKQRFGIVGDKKEWDYKPRHENDYGLEDEHSEAESDDERDIVVRRPLPPWAKRVMALKTPMLNSITLEMLCEYMYCPQKSPDILKMFNMTPTKRIKRTSSAIWNTPTS